MATMAATKLAGKGWFAGAAEGGRLHVAGEPGQPRSIACPQEGTKICG